MKKTLLTLAMMLGGWLGTQAQETLTLDDTQDLVPIINEAAEAGGTYNVTFSDRPINIDSWNVLCLPFDIRPAQFKQYLGTVVVDLLDETSDDGNIHFEPSVSGTITAGTPFIINVGKMKRTPTNFKWVTFKDVTLQTVEASYTLTDNYGNRFISTFSPVTFYGEKFWYMSKGKWYDATLWTEENPVPLKPLRCYVDFTENTTTPAPKIIIREPDGTTTTIDAATFNTGEFSTKASQDNAWYTLTGIRLNEKPTTRGVYIHQGRKVIIR
jgi:hypothetical protein